MKNVSRIFVLFFLIAVFGLYDIANGKDVGRILNRFCYDKCQKEQQEAC